MKRSDQRTTRQLRVHDLALYSDPLAMNDAHAWETVIVRLLQVLRDQLFNITGREGMQVDMIFHRHLDRLDAKRLGIIKIIRFIELIHTSSPGYSLFPCYCDWYKRRRLRTGCY